MDQQTFELLRVLQSGERSATVFAEIQRSLEPQRRALHATDDRASLADISELLEVWAEGAEPALSAAAIAHAAAIADQDLEQSERAVGLYMRSIELDPSQSIVLDRLEAMFKALAQHERFEAVLVKAVESLKARGEASADATAAALRRLGKLRLQLKSGLDGAVSAYEQALELSADAELIRELADLYAQRRADGDGRQAADLYATLAEVQGAETGVPLLDRALDLVPGHVEALTLLESFIPEAERPERLKDRWVAFVKDTEDEAAAGERMIALARLSLARGEHHSVLEWVAPAAERGDSAALELQAQALAAIQQQESGGDASAEGKKGAIRPATLVGFRVPVGSAPKDGGDQSAPGARKPKKARSGDTIVGFRVPEELAATPAERAADRAASGSGAAPRRNPLDAAFANANAKGGLGSASKPAAKPAATSAQPATNKSASPKTATASKPAERAPAKTSAPAPSASRSTNGGLGPALASGGKRQSPLPASTSMSASATASAGSAANASHGDSGSAPALRGGASLSPAQRSAALRKSNPPPAAEPAAASASAATVPAPAAEPTPLLAPIGMSPAAAHAAALRATHPSAEPAASGAAQAAATALLRASAPPAIQSPAAAAAAALAMQPRASAPPPLTHGSQANAAHAIDAFAVQSQAPLPRPSSEPERHNDELSGVRARPTLLDKRVLAIGAAALVLIVSGIALTRGKSSTPPAASADSAPAEEPPAAPTPPPAAATTTTASAVGATGSTPTTASPTTTAGTTPSAATPSALAAAVTPKATTAPAPVAPEPSKGRVEVQVSEIRVKGGKVKTQELLAAMSKNLKTLQHCYEEVLEDHPKTVGTLNYSFTIDKKGNPTKVKKASGTIKDSRVLKCTQRAIEKSDFPKPAKAKPAQVTLPLEFKKS